MDRFYLGFCNKTIWPLFHNFPMLTHYEEENWQEYRNINRLFGEAVVNALRPDDILWIHDYHLMLLPKLVREKFPDAAARLARGNSGWAARFEPDWFSHA